MEKFKQTTYGKRFDKLHPALELQRIDYTSRLRLGLEFQ